MYNHLIKRHSTSQLEIKTKYPLDKNKYSEKMQMELYFFIPRQLHPDGDLKEEFLKNIRSQSRNTTPYLSFDELLDLSEEKSPLTRISRLRTKMPLSDLRIDQLVYELKNFVNMYRVNIRRSFSKLQPMDGSADVCRKKVEKILSVLDQVNESFQEIKTVFSEPDDLVQDSFSRADESLSILREKFLFDVYGVFFGIGEKKQGKELVFERLEREEHFRKKCGYESRIKLEKDILNEEFLYRDNLLKKWAQSVLYLNRKRAKIINQIGDIVAGTAAGVAMTVALIATLIANQYLSTGGIVWALLVVMAYILKDRIKDLTRRGLIKKFPALIYDDGDDLIDTRDKRRIGFTRIRVNSVRRKNLPNEVSVARNLKNNRYCSILPPEVVLHYQRNINIKSRRFLSGHSRIDSLTEVIRINIRGLLGNMDEPYNTIFARTADNVVKVKARRVYHLHLVVILKDRSSSSLTHYRIVLNRKSILRIEEIPSV